MRMEDIEEEADIILKVFTSSISCRRLSFHLDYEHYNCHSQPHLSFGCLTLVLVYLISMDLNLGHVLVELAEGDLLLKPSKHELLTQFGGREGKGWHDLQLVDFTGRPTRHLGEDEPRNKDSDGTRTSEEETRLSNKLVL